MKVDILRKPPGRKAANLNENSTKEAAQKSIRTSCPSGLKTRPLFPLGWVFSATFTLAWKLTKELNVRVILWKVDNQQKPLLNQVADTQSFPIGWPCGEEPATHLSLSFILRNIFGVRLRILSMVNLQLIKLTYVISLGTFSSKISNLIRVVPRKKTFQSL